VESIKPYCIDSDVLIDHLRGVEAARNFLLAASKHTTLYISVVSIAELYAGQGIRDAEKRAQLDEFLKGFVGILLDGTIAQYPGVLQREYHQPFADSIIAASAMQYNLRLVTKNTKHFEAVAQGENLETVKPY
jgi:predicted nucleic acid-binding protein